MHRALSSLVCVCVVPVYITLVLGPKYSYTFAVNTDNANLHTTPSDLRVEYGYTKGSRLEGTPCQTDSNCPRHYICKDDPTKKNLPPALKRLKKTCQRGTRLAGEPCQVSSDCAEYYICDFDPTKKDHPSVLEQLKKTCQLDTRSKTTSPSSSSAWITVGIIIGCVVVAGVFYLIFKSNALCSEEQVTPTPQIDMSPPLPRRPPRPRSLRSPVQHSEDQTEQRQSTNSRRTVPSGSPEDAEIMNAVDLPPSYLDALSETLPVVTNERPPSYNSVQRATKR